MKELFSDSCAVTKIVLSIVFCSLLGILTLLICAGGPSGVEQYLSGDHPLKMIGFTFALVLLTLFYCLLLIWGFLYIQDIKDRNFKAKNKGNLADPFDN